MSILWTALRERPDVVIVDSGTTHWFLLAPLRIARIPVIASLHALLWPPGFPPARPSRRLVLWLAGWFWRHIAQATICVSPELERQVYTVAGKPRGRVFQYRAQYRRSLFESVAPRPPHELRPFRVLFVGRVEANKGVFDLLAMAARLDALLPGQFEWHVCGHGSAAIDVLGDAFVAAQPDDVESYVAAIRRLAEDRAEYDRRAAACVAAQHQFLDPENGLRVALARAIASVG